MRIVPAAAALALGAAFVSVGVAAPAHADSCDHLSDYPDAYRACEMSPMVGQCNDPPPQLVTFYRNAALDLQKAASDQAAAQDRAKAIKACHDDNKNADPATLPAICGG